MRTSMMSVTPFFGTGSISLSRMAREAFAMSMVFSPTPSQKRAGRWTSRPIPRPGSGNRSFRRRLRHTIEEAT
jgi:hypothetical protein